MKKKILIVSLAINIIAGAFIFYSFTSKTKSVSDGGGYAVMNVYMGGSTANKISISDGSSELSNTDLNPLSINANKWPDILKENNQIITKKINDLKSQGYELVSSNSGGLSGTLYNYIFVKK